jgi:hypothetical protein
MDDPKQKPEADRLTDWVADGAQVFGAGAQP